MFHDYPAWLLRQAALVVAVVCLAVILPATAVLARNNNTTAAWIEQILARNPQLQAAQAALDAADAGLRAADQPLFNPELELDLERTDIDTRSIGISQTLDWSDKRNAQTHIARLKKDIIRIEFQQQRRALATQLLRALANWQSATDIVAIHQKQKQLMAQFADLAERRHKAGDLGQAELGLAHLAAADARFLLATAITNQIRARGAVDAVAGQAHIRLPHFAPELPDIDSSARNIEKTLDDLPQIRAAKAKITLASAGVTLRKRQRRANPTIGLRLGKENSNHLTGINFSIPLFVRNRFKAEVEQAGASVIQTSREAAALRQQTRAQLLAAAAVYQNIRAAWTEWEASGAPVLSQRTRLLDQLWRAGEMRTTDYLVQLKQTLETETNAIEQQGQLWLAWIDWLSTSGEIEQWLNREIQ